MLRRVLPVLCFALIATSADARLDHGTVLNKDGKPTPGAYVWRERDRRIVRTDARGAFKFPDGAAGRRVFAAAGSSFAQAETSGNALIVLKLEPRLRDTGLVGQGAAILKEPHTAKFARVVAGFRASLEPDRFLIDSDDELTERGLVEILRRMPMKAEAALARIAAIREPFLQCRLANTFALSTLASKPDLARRAFELSDSLWRAGLVGGNDLQFPWVALSFRFAPAEANDRWEGALYWVKNSADPLAARVSLGSVIASVDLRRATTLFDDLPLGPKNDGLLRLASTMIGSNPNAARAILGEVGRHDSQGAASAERDRLRLALVERLRDSEPDVVRELAQGSDHPKIRAALAHVERRLDVRRSDENYRRAAATEDLEAACVVAGQALADDKALGKSLLAAVRNRVFAALEAQPQPVEVLVAFARAIHSVDPAAARIALERGIADCGFNVVPKATLIGWLAILDPIRAVYLADSMENPEWRDAARIVVGGFLALNRSPEPLADI